MVSKGKEWFSTAMDTKEKTAAISTSLNILLTLFKFAMFAFTGSLAILAEAWHSFSDIATSFLVFLAVFERGKGKEEDREKGSLMEGIVSLTIGLLLAVVSALLIVKFFRSGPTPVRNSLLSGVLFLVFALGSYLVYRFETAVGRQENSVGLIADGMHSRADMVASLIAGFSLILYHLGLDLDRWAGGVIALFILSFALETLINSTLSVLHKKKDFIGERKSHKIQTALLDRESWITLAEFFRSRTVVKAAGRVLPRKVLGPLLALALLCAAGWLTSTCFFSVGFSEHAIVERFGRPLAPEAPLGPGLHTKLPWPIDRAVTVDTEMIRQMNIGNEVDANTFALLWTRQHGTEIPFLSGDNNYFFPYLVLHYRIGDLGDFLYRYDDPEAILKVSAFRTITELFATKGFYDIVLDFRKELPARLLQTVREEMKRLGTGIDLFAVNVKDIHPPINVADSFEGVIAALQEKEELVNKALGNASEYLLESEGEAARLEEDAAAYTVDQKLRAEGDATLFLAKIPRGKEAVAVTRTRLYLKALQQALSRRDKVLVDPRAGIPEMWLNLGEALGGKAPEFDQNSF